VGGGRRANHKQSTTSTERFEGTSRTDDGRKDHDYETGSEENLKSQMEYNVILVQVFDGVQNLTSQKESDWHRKCHNH
jgi:hypothetical protein